MKELLKAINSSTLAEKVSLLPQALKHGELGIDFLIDCLEAPELEIRATAYQLLQDIKSQKVQQAIAPGILFNPGDKIYHVVQSSMWFNDSFYSLYPSKTDSREINLCTQDDYRYQGYKIISFEETAYIIGYAPYYLNYDLAKSKAEFLHRKEIPGISISEFDLFNLKDQQKVIRQWCQRYQILEEVRCLQIKRDKQTGTDKWYQSLNIANNLADSEFLLWCTVEEYLKSIHNIDLLAQLWQDLIGKLAYVYETCFQKKTYLTIDPYYSQILSEPEGISRYLFGVDEEELSSSSEEAEINSLLTALNNSKLETRSLAYQLLQGIDSKNAANAIYQGIKVNPGDKIYSVYQSGIGFDDETYYLHDDVDYDEQIHYQITGTYQDNPNAYSRRMYGTTNKKKAEKIAELLHRELIKQNKLCLDWRKSNPRFNLKNWCRNNNVSYKKEWDECKIPWDGLNSFTTILEIKEIIHDNEKLMDDFRRSRYIYHPKHIDTWCRDNNICYEKICDENNKDYWHNYRKVLDYINLPENIELLSKFWKDGVGHFAFFREEIVQQTAYIRIGHCLDSESGEDKLFAVPKEYETESGKLIIKILEDRKSKQKSKTKAREMLQEFDWEEIPF